MEGVAAVLDADVEQAQRQEGDVGVAVVDVADGCHGGFAGGAALFGVDEVGDLEGEGEVGLEVLGRAGVLDVALEGCDGGLVGVGEAVAGGVSRRGCLHGGGGGVGRLGGTSEMVNVMRR